MSPANGQFHVPAHFHQHATEFMRCVAGQLNLTLDEREVKLRPENGELKIRKGAVHTISSPKGEHVELHERTDVGPVTKREFLRNMLHLSSSDKSVFASIKILTLFYEDGDTFPVPAHSPKSVGRLMVWFISSVRSLDEGSANKLRLIEQSTFVWILSAIDPIHPH